MAAPCGCNKLCWPLTGVLILQEPRQPEALVFAQQGLGDLRERENEGGSKGAGLGSMLSAARGSQGSGALLLQARLWDRCHC